MFSCSHYFSKKNIIWQLQVKKHYNDPKKISQTFKIAFDYEMHQALKRSSILGALFDVSQP